jgi:hypothetical protein
MKPDLTLCSIGPAVEVAQADEFKLEKPLCPYPKTL